MGFWEEARVEGVCRREGLGCGIRGLLRGLLEVLYSICRLSVLGRRIFLGFGWLGACAATVER